VRAYVGVTDNNWYRFLADRPGVTEVNFWQPSGAREFRVLAPGEPFFFKTHYPHNRLVGGGFFSDSARLRVLEAWEFFGEANGVWLCSGGLQDRNWPLTCGAKGTRTPGLLDANHIFAYFYVALCRLMRLLPAEIVAGCRWASLGV
jgi:hypothetical protein